MNVKRLHQAFEISLLFKAAFALAEIVGGAVVYVTTQQFWLSVVRVVTADELAEDPQDFVANYLKRSVLHLSGTCQKFCVRGQNS